MLNALGGTHTHTHIHTHTHTHIHTHIYSYLFNKKYSNKLEEIDYIVIEITIAAKSNETMK